MAGPSSGCSLERMDITERRVCVWLCRQPDSNAPIAAPGWLTQTEHQRLASLAGPRVREFLASRWLIRQALSAVCGGQHRPEQCRPVPGRPVASQMPAGWHLSISHSQGLAACALSRQPLGVDLEPLQRRPGWQKVTRRWFSETEQAWLLERDDPQTFLQAWTFKEAWLKATGRGIAGNLQTLEVAPGFELSGDRPDACWQADSLAVEDFLVTVVYQTPDATPHRPAFHWLAPPPEDFNLCTAEDRTIDASLALHRSIQPGHPSRPLPEAT
ncbi:4'-phosphopantetheinyl transferase [Marinobacter persicus]|uniref:4'-phosphopantetheinyl transferase n=2 Tax=Marinobacter persicus TaxID=930118 RepID=A0A1I3VB84_9GAMM|nr:4'-phosphopantetheinyl transferase [Marinobacter persicus]